MVKRYKYYPHFEEILRGEGIYVESIKSIDQARSLIETYQESMGMMIPTSQSKDLLEEIKEIHKFEEESFVSAYTIQEQEERFLAGLTTEHPITEEKKEPSEKLNEDDSSESITEEDTSTEEPQVNEANRDGTGPEGKGPKTGKGKGSCKEDEEQKEGVKEEDNNTKDNNKEDKDRMEEEVGDTVTEGKDPEQTKKKSGDKTPEYLKHPEDLTDADKMATEAIERDLDKAKIGMKVNFEGQEAVVTKLLDEKGTKVNLMTREGEKDNVDVTKLSYIVGKTKKGEKVEKEKDIQKKEAAKEAIEEPETKEVKEDTSQTSTGVTIDAIKEALDNVALTKSQRDNILEEVMKNKQGKIEKEESPQKTPEVDKENSKEPTENKKDKDETPPTDTGDKASKQQPKLDKGEDTPVKNVDKGDEPEKEKEKEPKEDAKVVKESTDTEVVCRTIFSIFEFVLDEDFKEYLVNIVSEDEVDKFITEAVDQGLISIKEDEVYTKGDKLI